MSSEPRVNRKSTANRESLEHLPLHRAVHSHGHRRPRKLLRVMKFGGTSVGDAGCIRKVVEIVRNYSVDSDLVVVVSAMSGVTNKLIQAGNYAASGNLQDAASFLAALESQHLSAIEELVHSEPARRELSSHIGKLVAQCGSWCEDAARAGELSPALQDLISGLGERLNAPLIAAALSNQEVEADAVEASELVVTTSYHGAADPLMQPTRERCQAYLRPILQKGFIPVVTGFIGVSPEGALTTLGRGGSDYSATILGAAMGADEVIIWTDVDGMLTADPRVVPSANTIPEISYTEAAELAYFGAKVLHPKTLDPVLRQGIPVWIRNTFAPEINGTKITPTVGDGKAGVRALTATDDATLITITGSLPASSGLLRRTRSALEHSHVDILMISESLPHIELRLVVAKKFAGLSFESLRQEFQPELASGSIKNIFSDSNISMLTVVGQNSESVKEIVHTAMAELVREKIDVIATGQRSSTCSISFVIRKSDINSALLNMHKALQSKFIDSASKSRRSEASMTANSAVPSQVRRGTRAGEQGLNFRRDEGAFLPELGKSRESVILDEAAFRRTIALERKRTERSRSPMLLMLLNAGDRLPFDKSGRVLSNVLSALSLSTRDTDVVGWYKDQSVVGVMFTDLTLDDHGEILGTMMHRVSQTLRNNLSLEKFSQIGITMHMFPESWSQETSPRNPALYPDLAQREDTQRSALAIKRLMDILGSAGALLVLSPLFLVIAALVKLSSKGPILFKQERLGQFGKPFTFLKFRSMYVNNNSKIHQEFMKKVIAGEHDGKMNGEKNKVYKMTNDPRITPVGRFLRRTSLDELPQFFNVLRGDMSLVGPRPPIAYECREYDIWHRRRVLEVRPGITGLWQVTGRSRVRFDEMVRLDLQYVRTWSLWNDIKIMLKTPAAVLLGNDAF